MSSEMQALSREIDVVTVKGSVKPMRFFTINMEEEGLKIIPDRYEHMGPKEKKTLRTLEKTTLLDKIFDGEKHAYEIIKRDDDFKELRRFINKKFDLIFDEGYKYYIKGDWKKSYDLLQQGLVMSPNDGPSMTILSVIESENIKSPKDWEGYRNLTEK
jgi:hypothetical protein